MNDENQVLTFDSLCVKFKNLININKYLEADEVNKIIKQRFPKEIHTNSYYNIILKYYTNKEESLKLYDQLFLSVGFNKFAPEGYFFSMKIESFKKVPIKINLPNPWVPLNPSIIRKDDRYILNIRVSNYRIFPGGKYISLDSDKIIRTRNIIRELDLDLKVIDEYELIQPATYQRSDWGIKGFEDVRLVSWNDQLFFSAATYDTHKLNVQRVVLCEIRDKKIYSVINLDIPGQKRTTEKNWLPYVKDNKLLFVYSYHPFIILNSSDPKKIKVHSNFKSDNYDFRQFRGSCSPINYKDGEILLIHQVYTKSDNSKVYLQRLLYIKDNKIYGISHQFYFDCHQIEFCSGMCNDKNGDFLFTFGINDLSAYIYSVKKEVIDSMIVNTID